MVLLNRWQTENFICKLFTVSQQYYVSAVHLYRQMLTLLSVVHI